jgi:hypothetical protein
MGEFKREFKKMCDNYGIKIKKYKSHYTTHKQTQSLSEYTKLHTVNDMLRSFDLANNHENLEEKEDNTCVYSLK